VEFLILTDHATPVSTRTHYACPVPFVIYHKHTGRAGCATGYDERTGDRIMSGEELIAYFLRGQKK
jgi:2,3-bisphosphoglycerate-independent phosphoglycerate mutase